VSAIKTKTVSLYVVKSLRLRVTIGGGEVVPALVETGVEINVIILEVAESVGLGIC
jgi:hypothetical protein